MLKLYIDCHTFVIRGNNAKILMKKKKKETERPGATEQLAVRIKSDSNTEQQHCIVAPMEGLWIILFCFIRQVSIFFCGYHQLTCILRAPMEDPALCPTFHEYSSCTFPLVTYSPPKLNGLPTIRSTISPQRRGMNHQKVLPSLRDALTRGSNLNSPILYGLPSRLPFSAPTKATLDSSTDDLPGPVQPRQISRKLSIQDLLCFQKNTLNISTRKPPNPRRQCKVLECFKYALAGGFCIRHGGGRRCKKEGCQTVAQSGGLCKAHGGGSRCRVLGCDNVARRQGFCMIHGGRIECKFPGCYKCAHRGGYCIAHGGGKRCSVYKCERSVQTKGLCYSHGGGKRCSVENCHQAARKGGSCMRHRDTQHSK